MTTQTHQEGGCQCGAVRYRTTMTPLRGIACHCTTCKLRTGAGYGIGVYFPEDQVEFLQGSLRTFEFHSDESGHWLRNRFCEQCGTAVCWTLEMRPGVIGVAGGTYDHPGWFEISAHIWTRSARPDMCYPQGMATHEKALPPSPEQGPQKDP